ncbi:MAG: 1-acyl-sn-glycerol-3-phosphate acyltransferase [Oligoflexia bacterium]|nr:1-acyl-sn-glycerol-3-phosphate acyltransferase [Oligoflexia bacterium]
MGKCPASTSDPAVRFEHLPLISGPLGHLNAQRPRIMADVIRRTLQDFESGPLDLVLGESLYQERQRLKREQINLFTRGRHKADQRLWSEIQTGLLQSSVSVDRKGLLKQVTRHYADEIAGRFNPEIYKVATHAVPFAFSWFLNAASVRRFLPWGLSESLATRLSIVGEVSHLQKLAQKGTILLVPTHQSNLDSVLIGYVIYLMSLPPFAYGAGLNLFSNPVLSFFMGNLGAYTVDRKKSNAIYKQTLKNYSTTILREGIHSIFFPGGGRSRSGAIERRLKLGLLGTALDAQIEKLRNGSDKPNVYVVPMVMSYHFVLEAASLIEDFLAESGKHRFIITDDESWQSAKVLNFFWKLFSSQSGIVVRIGMPMDVFGNPVDENGASMGPNGTTIDPRKWLTTRGELRADAARDHEYTRELGERIAERFHRDNTVMTSHVVAFAFFELLRSRYPELDLYRFLRLSAEQRTLQLEGFLAYAQQVHAKLLQMEAQGELYLSQELHAADLRAWVDDGIKQLGVIHDAAVVKVAEDSVWTEDMNLLYYYRNRLTGYGGLKKTMGNCGRKGFLE